MEGEDEHGGAGVLHGLGEDGLGGVVEVGTVGLKHIVKAVAELQFGTKLKEREVVIAAHADFKIKGKRFGGDIGLVFGGEVVGGVEARDDIRAIVVVTRRRHLYIKGQNNISGLHGLMLHIAGGLFAESDVLGGEMHRGQQSESQKRIDAPFANQSYGEAGREIVVAHKPLTASFGVDVAGVWHDQALLMDAKGESIVERAQIDIRAVLHLAVLLRQGCGGSLHRQSRAQPHSGQHNQKQSIDFLLYIVRHTKRNNGKRTCLVFESKKKGAYAARERKKAYLCQTFTIHTTLLTLKTY